MAAYYNDNDPFVCEWLKNLIGRGLIADGEVDGRPISEVEANDVRGFDQVHFFAGISGWSYALRLAGWPDDRPVWTGSCPCQPFSVAGKGEGKSDKRHLWPEWFRLIRECRPSTIFGEQVGGAIAHGWLDLVFNDLEMEGYACGAAVLPACSVGAFHIRQRLWFVANALPAGRDARGAGAGDGQAIGSNDQCRMADTPGDNGRPGERGEEAGIGPDGERGRGLAGGGKDGEVENSPFGTAKRRRQELGESPERMQDETQKQRIRIDIGNDIPINCWSSAGWLPCRDGKARPVEPGVFPLAHGVPARVGRLRAYGNAIVPQVAAEFVRAFMEISGDER